MRSPEWQAEVDELREENRQLKERLEPPDVIGRLMCGTSMSIMQARAMAALLRSPQSNDWLMAAIYPEGYYVDGGGSLSPTINKLRNMFGRNSILTVRGWGYQLSPEGRAKVEQIIAG